MKIKNIQKILDNVGMFLWPFWPQSMQLNNIVHISKCTVNKI